MRRYAIIMIALALVIGTFDYVLANGENLPAKGTKELMFGFSGWYLGGYEGGVGFRYYLREKTALRLGVDIGWTKDDIASDDEEYREGFGTEWSNRTTDRSYFSLGIGGVMERHFISSSNLVPYAGVGLFGGIEKRDSDSAEQDSNDGMSKYAYESTGYSVEGLLLFGLQWHFGPSMSLAGEYNISLRYFHEDYEYTSGGDDWQRTDYDTTKEYDLVLDSSRLWLSIAF